MAATHCLQARYVPACIIPEPRAERSRVPATAGLILVDSSAKPVYYSSEAIALLSYAQPVNQHKPRLPVEIKSWLGRSAASPGSSRPVEFVCGWRRYTCRAFPLVHGGCSTPSHTLTALLIERKCGNSIQSLDIAARFHLSPREEETVRLLALGLTSKQIATRMNISPNTVKTFFRLIMTKMGVTTRSGVVGRVAGL